MHLSLLCVAFPFVHMNHLLLHFEEKRIKYLPNRQTVHVIL